MSVLSNARHERFCQELAKGKSADEAYQIAGFRPNRGNASVLKAKQNISKRVAELQAKVAEKAAIDAAWVLKRLVENVDRAMQTEAVLDNEGKPTGEYHYEGNVANRALELIGKHVAVQAFRDQMALTGADGGPIQTEDVSARDVIADRLGELAARSTEKPQDTKH